jgi:hypothetical protein
MLLAKLLLLPMAVASSVTLYVASVPVSDNTAIIPSPIPLAQIEYDADQSVGTLSSYTPPTGSYASDHFLRVGLQDTGSGAWRGIVTSAASFADEYHKKFVIHVDEKGEPFYVGFGTSAKRAGGDVEVEIIKRSSGPKPVLNKPIVLNAEGKIDAKEPEKSFLQKCVANFIFAITGLVLTNLQVLVGHRTVLGRSTGRRWRRWEIVAQPCTMRHIMTMEKAWSDLYKIRSDADFPAQHALSFCMFPTGTHVGLRSEALTRAFSSSGELRTQAHVWIKERMVIYEYGSERKPHP